MPTPIGHGIAGIAAGWAVAGPRRSRRALVIQSGILAMVGAAADLDLLVHDHRAATHSIGAAAIVATFAAWRRWPIAQTRSRIWWAAFIAWCTHPLLDALAIDTAPPIGIMAFWPFSHTYVQTGWSVFAPVSRSVAAPGFLWMTCVAVSRELIILLPVVCVVWWLRSRSFD